MTLSRSIVIIAAVGLYMGVTGMPSVEAVQRDRLVMAPSAAYTFLPIELSSWCTCGDLSICSRARQNAPLHYRQVVVLPAGYTAEEYWQFKSDFDTLVSKMSNEGDTTYATARRDHILYFGAWLPGQPLASSAANFGARVITNPFRGKALTLKSGDVVAAINMLKSKNVRLSPSGVIVLFNTQEGGITANAIPPVYMNTGYGIAKVARAHLDTAYTGIHELAHAFLNFLDEYVEDGFQEFNIQSLDALTPLAVLDGSWGGWVNAIENALGIYSMKISEVLASNGNDNIDVTPYTSRVSTPTDFINSYEYEGGAFFGRGTWHDAFDNIMNGNTVVRGPGDDFAYAHSRSQADVVRQAFEDPARASRPNDRIRNAGPLKSWAVGWGPAVRIMMFDADKHHQYHPTLFYDVQVTWQDRQWKVCYNSWGIPYPCLRFVQKTAQKTVWPEERRLNLQASSLASVATLVQKVLCTVGFSRIEQGNDAVDLCSQSIGSMSGTLLPTIVFRIPYQEVSVPTDQSLTTYQWRFRTNNGTHTSGWTGWASFYRAF